MINDVLCRIVVTKRDRRRMFNIKTEKLCFEGAGYMGVTTPVVFKE